MVGITNISFTKTVAVSLNEAMPFALRNSNMDDTEVTVLSIPLQNRKLPLETFSVYISGP